MRKYTKTEIANGMKDKAARIRAAVTALSAFEHHIPTYEYVAVYSFSELKDPAVEEFLANSPRAKVLGINRDEETVIIGVECDGSARSFIDGRSVVVPAN